MGGEEDDNDDDGGGGDGEDEGDDDGGDGGSPAADAISAVVSKRPRGDDMRMRKFRHLFFRSLAGVGGGGAGGGAGGGGGSGMEGGGGPHFSRWRWCGVCFFSRQFLLFFFSLPVILFFPSRSRGGSSFLFFANLVLARVRIKL